MEPAELDSERGWRGFARHFLAWFKASSVLRWGLFLTIAVSLFYAEENWRGKRTWDRHKHEQKSKGRILDWSSRTQPAVPDAENFYQSPGMKEWFLDTSAGSPSTRIYPYRVPASHLNRLLKVVVEILPFRAEDEVAPTNSDLVLEYDPPVMRFYRSPGGAAALPKTPASNVIPLIMMDDVPLLDAIRNLARQAGANYMLDPKALLYGPTDANGTPLSQTRVSLRWENLTAMQALRALLRNYNLVWLEDPKTGIGRIIVGDPNQPPVVLDNGVRERLEALVRGSFGPLVYGSQGNPIFSRPIDDAKPVRVAIRTHAPLGVGDLAFLTSRQEFVYGEALLGGLTIKETPNHCFFVMVPPTTACVASDYLDWSDRFEPDFDQMREALKRPYAVLPGSSTNPANMPVEDFTALRTVSQTLAQRAQCQLLSGEPGEALKELTLMHDLCRILDGPPTNRHTTLGAAMIDVALAELYGGVVADGLHLRAWQEPQLATLQAQLEGVNLCPTLMRAFAQEPSFTCSTLEKAAATQRNQAQLFGSSSLSLSQKLKYPRYLMLDIAPRGWIYLNMVNLDGLLQSLNDVLDSSGKFVVPHKVEMAGSNVQAVVTHFSLNTALAWFAVPNVVHAHKTMAFTQTTINQLALACALERYNLSRGRYPDSLEALVPEFVRALPADIVNGRPLQYCRIPGQGYQLYSVGWDETDDRGIPVRAGAWGNEIAKGDWTWQFPVN